MQVKKIIKKPLIMRGKLTENKYCVIAIVKIESL